MNAALPTAGPFPTLAAAGPVVGHDAVFDRFARALARGRLASTYLLVGPEGVGKRTAALALASHLLCLRPPRDPRSGCGACDSCRLAAAGTHPDLHVVTRPPGKSSLGIELFIGDQEHRHRTGLCHDVALRPMVASRRVAVIDGAELLGVEAANSLLKTLEEPPPRSVFFLVSGSFARLLPTIRSRCQVVRFGPLSDDEVARVLVATQASTDGPAAASRAATAGGSVGRALRSATGEEVAFLDRLTAQLGGGFNPIELAAGALALVSDNKATPAEKRERLAGVVSHAAGFYRDQMVALAQRGDLPAAERAADRVALCLDAQDQLFRNANQATLVQAWLTSLAGRQAP